MMNSMASMGWIGGIFAILVLAFLVLGIAALIKYLKF